MCEGAAMAKLCAIQMDPIESIDVNGDSSLMLALEAQRRGYDLFHYLPQSLSLKNGQVTARGCSLTVRYDPADHYTLGEEQVIDLAGSDVVLMRQDPPFDMCYITATHILAHIHPGTLVVNDPASVRNAPEKLFVTHFDALMPPTLISNDRAEIMAFREEYKDIVVKPLFGNGGTGVFHIKPNDENLTALLEVFAQMFREPVIVQRYEPAVRLGDKRVILVDGEPVGGINRVPAQGEARANMHVGGRAKKTDLTPREREICEAIGPTLRQQGLIFVGIDVIGDYMTEINVTSPTGIQEMNRFDGVQVEAIVWDAIERKL